MANLPELAGFPSHEAVLEGLRRTCYRQVVRYRHGRLFDALVHMEFVVWVRQPVWLPRPPVSDRNRRYQPPVEVAELTDTGRAALDWLTGLEQSAQWASLRTRPYDLPRASDVS